MLPGILTATARQNIGHDGWLSGDKIENLEWEGLSEGEGKNVVVGSGSGTGHCVREGDLWAKG